MDFFSTISDKIALGGNWLLILVFLAAGLGIGLALGRNKLSVMVLSVYISLAVIKSIPWGSDFFNLEEPDANVKIFIFLALALGIFFIAPHSGLASILRLHGRGRAGWWQLTLLGVSLLGFFISVVVSFLPGKTVQDLDPLLSKFFADKLAQFIWVILPLAAMLALKHRKTYGGGDEE